MDQFSNHPLYKRHNIDSAMNSIWIFYKEKFLTLFFVSFLMSLILQYASTFVDMKEFQSITDPMIMLEKIKGYIVPFLIISLINLLFTTFLQYYIIFNPLNSGNNIFISIIRSLKYYIPFLIIMVLLAFAGSISIVIGVFLLIIGMFFAVLYVITLYLFILPVMMAEEANIWETIKRVITLAHRNFWSNLGWVAVFIIILLVVTVIFSGLILIPFTGSFLKTITNPEGATKVLNVASNPLFIVLSAAVSALTLPLMPIFGAVLYFNGKAGEEQDKNRKPEEPKNDRVRVEDLYAKPYSDDHPENPKNIG